MRVKFHAQGNNKSLWWGSNIRLCEWLITSQTYYPLHDFVNDWLRVRHSTHCTTLWMTDYESDILPIARLCFKLQQVNQMFILILLMFNKNWFTCTLVKNILRNSTFCSSIFTIFFYTVTHLDHFSHSKYANSLLFPLHIKLYQTIIVSGKLLL